MCLYFRQILSVEQCISCIIVCPRYSSCFYLPLIKLSLAKELYSVTHYLTERVMNMARIHLMIVCIYDSLRKYLLENILTQAFVKYLCLVGGACYKASH